MDKNTYAYRWDSAARTIPEEPVIYYGDKTFTWRLFQQRSNRLAHALLELGMRRQDKVGIMQFNSNQYMEALYASLMTALVPVNVNYRYYQDELHYIIDNSDAAVLIFNEDFVDRIASIRDRLDKVKAFIVIGEGEYPDMYRYEDLIASHPGSKPALPWAEPTGDDLVFVYTGGTTGLPKAVMWRQEDGVLGMVGILIKGVSDNNKRLADAPTLVSDSRLWTNGFNRWLLRRDIVEKTSYQLLSALFNRPRLISYLIRGRLKIILCCPMIHGTALVGAMVGTMIGGSLVFLTGKSFDARELWQVVDRMGREAARTEVVGLMIVGDAFAVPMVEELERGDYDTSALNLIFSSGVLWSPEMKRKLLEHIPQVILQDVLGATEGLSTGYATTSSHREIPRATFKVRDGGPFPVRVINEETGEDVVPGSGEIGVMAVGGHVPVGYWKDPERTARVFKNIGGRRYNVFGDMCTVDAEGFVHLLGRGSECINTGGEKVYPEEVEETILDHPKVEDVGVVGTPHRRWGEAVTAVVVLRKGESATEEEIIDFCRGKIADYKKPKRVLFLSSLDRQPSGKKEYKLIREKAEEALRIE